MFLIKTDPDHFILLINNVEILEDIPEVDIVLVPLGGGGLVCGVALSIKQTHPHVKVFGVEALGASSMYNSMQAGHIVAVDVNTVSYTSRS